MHSRFDQESRRLAELLDDLVRLAGLSYRAVEARAGVSYNTLWRVLRGATKLQLSHFLLILDALDIHPADFMEIAFPVRKLNKPDPEVLLRVRALAVQPGSRPARTLEEITQRVGAALAALPAGPGREESVEATPPAPEEPGRTRRGPSGLRRPGRPRKRTPRP